MYPLSRTFLRSLFFLPILSIGTQAVANDQIFPALPAASSAISWQGGSFVVNGKSVFLASGEVHYARVPRELWRDRLWRMKMMGLNTVQTYVFWNAQEGREGEFNFSDNLDLDAWLTLVESMGMYAIVRPGPYNCAEWDNGGVPAWLTAKPGMQIRTDYAPYLQAVDRYLGQIYPIIAKHQINHGGSVLMVQLENEYPNNLWGTDGNAFLQHIYDFARLSGLEVPLFYSGLHHDYDPAGETPFGTRQYPWFSTEFWTGWIAQYGEMAPDVLARSVRGTWKIISFGGAGYSYYVAHGGSNFGYSHGSEEGAAYDYSAAIGQAGQLRGAYFPMRRASSFASTFADLLGRSANDGKETRTGVADGIRILTRSGTAGTAVFLDNDRGVLPIATRVTLGSPSRTFPLDAPLKLAPKEIRAVALLDVPWTTGAKFSSVVTGVLGRRTLAGKDYWVCYGQPGEGGEVTVSRNGVEERISLQYPADDSVNERQVLSGDGNIAVFLTMNTSLADRTWILPNAIYIGPRFVLEDGTVEFSSVGGKSIVYTASGRQEQQTAPASLLADPALGAWSWRDASPEAATAFDDSGWLSSTEALPMERYASFQNGYGWYRATFNSSAAGTIKVQFSGSAGDFRVYLNGAPASLDSLKVKSGSNTLAILAMTTARPKMYNFTGATGFSTSRGVWGPVTLTGSPSLTWSGWRFHGGLNGLDETPLIARVTNWPTFLAGAWQSTTPPANQPTFWRADFSYATAPGSSEILQLLADGLLRGQVWLNGHNLGPVPDAHPIYLPECWLNAQNTLIVFDAQGASPSQLRLQRVADFVPAAPTNLAANVQNGKINLTWTSPLGIPPDHFEIRRSPSLSGPFESFATVGASSSTFTDSPPTGSEVFYYQVSAVFSSGEVSNSSVVGARPTSGIRSPWISGDIGAVGVVGDAFLSQNVFSLSGSGSDIWDTADAFRYVFQPAAGDCTITARVVTQEDTDQWTKVGVMIRETFAPTSRQASMLTTSRNGIVFSRRTTAANTTNQSDANAMQTPYWVRVSRHGNTFTGYTSADGKTWAEMGSDTIAMASSVYVGLAATSHNNAVTCTATFSNVTLILDRPATPANFVATPLSDSGIQLAWSATGQDFVKYAIQYSPKGTKLWRTATNTLTADRTGYTVEGLDAATAYDFRLQAYATSGSSTYATASAATSAGLVASRAAAAEPAADSSTEDSQPPTETLLGPVTASLAASAPSATPTAPRVIIAPKPRRLAVLILSPTPNQTFPIDHAIPLRGRILTSRAATRIDLRWAGNRMVIRHRAGWFAEIPPLKQGLYTLRILLQDDRGRSAVKTRRFQVAD